MFTTELIDEIADAIFAWEDINFPRENENLIPADWMTK